MSTIGTKGLVRAALARICEDATNAEEKMHGVLGKKNIFLSFVLDGSAVGDELSE